MTTLQIILFLLLSIPALAVSVPHWRRPRSHGFFRFFGFEGTLLLVVLNLGAWLADPLTPMHLLSWLLLATSGLLAIHAYWMLRSRGRPERDLETTTILVRDGVYRFIRHPLYASLLFLAAGAFLKAPSIGTTILFALTALAFYLTALSEERENAARFGPTYDDYRKETKRFIPFLF